MSTKVRRMERMIVTKLVEDALDLGYMVILHDGEDKVAVAFMDGNTTKGREVEQIIRMKETEVAQIIRMFRATDEERLIFFKDGKRVGSLLLVYGNDGHDVIADHTSNDEMDKIVSGASALADTLAEGDDDGHETI